MDINKDLQTCNERIKSPKLSYISDVCNQFVLPNVFCPWEWSDVIHKVRYVDQDTVIQLCIQKCNLSIVDVSKLSKIEHTRNEYLQESDNYYDLWLHYPDWKVIPAISFVDGYRRVLTCKDHYYGYNVIHINYCIWITNIPSPISNRVCRASVKPWTVKHMKFGYNSTRYKKVEQRISCKSPNTINVSIFGNTDHGSILNQESEECAYDNCTDTKGLIKRLIDDENFPNDHDEGIKEFSFF